MLLRIKEDYMLLLESENSNKGIRQATVNCLGNVISMLEDAFPDISAEKLAINLLPAIQGEREPEKIWGFREYGNSLLCFYDFMDSIKSNYPTLEEIERFRIKYGITIAPTVIGFDEIYISKITSVVHVIYGILFYYALHGYGLKKCKFCGKWFVVEKGNSQKNYCNRQFSYVNWNNEKKEYENCQTAREKIMDSCKKREKTIYNRLNRYGQASDKTNSFMKSVNEYLIAIKENPSKENLVSYENFLYVDCDKYYHRYGRS